MLINYVMWPSNLFFFLRPTVCRVFHSPGFSEHSFFRVQVFQGLGFSESRFSRVQLFRVQVFQGPGFSASRFFWVQVFQGPVQGHDPGFKSSPEKTVDFISIN